MRVDINESLRHFAKVWRMDGDLMVCQGCGRGVIASRFSEPPRHKAECQKNGYMDNENPWVIFANTMDNMRSPQEPDEIPMFLRKQAE